MATNIVPNWLLLLLLQQGIVFFSYTHGKSRLMHNWPLCGFDVNNWHCTCFFSRYSNAVVHSYHGMLDICAKMIASLAHCTTQFAAIAAAVVCVVVNR